MTVTSPCGIDPVEDGQPVWFEDRPDSDGNFDEIVARFADGIVQVEMMSDNSVYVGFYRDDGRAHQMWIASKKRLRVSHADASGPMPSTPLASPSHNQKKDKRHDG